MNTRKHYVYTLAYPDGRVFYVGKGIGDRIDEHERDAKRGKGRNPHKINIIKKIWREGGEVSKAILTYFDTHEEACIYEIALIFFMDELVNKTDGGDGVNGYRPTEEALRKLSESHKGLVPSEEHKRKISEALRGRKRQPLSEEERHKRSEANKGHRQTEEQRRKQSESLKGHTTSEETRRKIGEAHKGKKLSEEQCRQLSERQKGQKRGPYPPERGRKISAAKMGHPVSEETRKKLSEANKNRSPETRQKMSEAWKRNPEGNMARIRKMVEARKRKAEIRNALQLELPDIDEAS